MDWVNTIVAVLSGLAVTIPLVVELVKYVKRAVAERNWGSLLQLIMKFMAEAETKFEEGADRKAWVIAMVRAASETINYTIDYTVVANLIDELCDLSKIVNPPVQH